MPSSSSMHKITEKLHLKFCCYGEAGHAPHFQIFKPSDDLVFLAAFNEQAEQFSTQFCKINWLTSTIACLV